MCTGRSSFVIRYDDVPEEFVLAVASSPDPPPNDLIERVSNGIRSRLRRLIELLPGDLRKKERLSSAGANQKSISPLITPVKDERTCDLRPMTYGAFPKSWCGMGTVNSHTDGSRSR
jgi:hypothetical protein